jgi:agarase
LTAPGETLSDILLVFAEHHWHDAKIMHPPIRLAFLIAIAALISYRSLAADNSNAKTNQFFHAAKIDGRWWLIDPNGHRFISKGVTSVQMGADAIQGTDVRPYLDATTVKYGTPAAWRKATAERLMSWGFNSLGAWSDDSISEVTVSNQHLAYGPIVDLGAHFVGVKQKGAAWLHGIFPDVFDPDFETIVHQRAREICTPRANDRSLLGWFADNELRWGPDWRGSEELITMFLTLPGDIPGKKSTVDLLRERYTDVKKFNEVWLTTFTSWDEVLASTTIKAPVQREAVYRQNQESERQANEADPKRAAFVADSDAFLARLAERYFRITAEAIKAADPNHMNFGSRFAYVPPQPVVAAAAKYLDAISFNCYRFDPRETIARYSVFGKPLIIGEFSFRGQDVGLPNSKGGGERVKTQADRAAAYKNFVTWGLSSPYLVGYHWFEHCDEPKEGRFDGENCNYGVVNIRDEVYVELTSAMTEINAQAETLHEAAK